MSAVQQESRTYLVVVLTAPALVALRNKAESLVCSQEGIPLYSGELPQSEFRGVATGGTTLDGKEQPATDARPFQHIGYLKTLYIIGLLEQVRLSEPLFGGSS